MRGGEVARRLAMPLLAAIIIVVLVAAWLAVRHGDAGDPGDAHDTPGGARPQSVDPFSTAAPYVWPSSTAAKAVVGLSGADKALMQRIARTPTAVWLTPEDHPVGHVAGFVSSVVNPAVQSGTVPVFVVYGIPQRDCAGAHSAGGLDSSSYLTWVSQIAHAAGGRSVVVLEPDALASAPQCGLVQQREQLLSQAIRELADGPTTYLDAGHADWVDATTMATMLKAAGVGRIRGFALNVSGYDADSSEQAYGDQIRAALGRGSYVIDSSRNGIGGTGAWCNPPQAALGVVPGPTPQVAGLDAHLWIKPPGESDGPCNGGPPAGQFWPQQALALARAAGW